MTEVVIKIGDTVRPSAFGKAYYKSGRAEDLDHQGFLPLNSDPARRLMRLGTVVEFLEGPGNQGWGVEDHDSGYIHAFALGTLEVVMYVIEELP